MNIEPLYVLLNGWLIVALLVVGLCWRYRATNKARRHPIPTQYLDGLNLILNDQHDKALNLFLEMFEVDGNTVETHLALGALFRRRGEVNRAIRIHQNLIARPNLSRQQRVHSLFELGQDYMRAGVLDRAETLFQELVTMHERVEQSLENLLSIYQQQRDWEQAIQTALKIESMLGKAMAHIIAHYYCELADAALSKHHTDAAYKLLRRAVQVYPMSVRAKLMQAQLNHYLGKNKLAVQALKTVAEKHPNYFSLVLEPLRQCFSALDHQDGFNEFTEQYFSNYPHLALQQATALKTETVSLVQFEQLFAKQIVESPTIVGLAAFLDFKMSHLRNSEEREIWQQLRDVMRKIVKSKPTYQCTHCGFSTRTLYWMCPSCKSWDTIKPFSETH